MPRSTDPITSGHEFCPVTGNHISDVQGECKFPGTADICGFAQNNISGSYILSHISSWIRYANICGVVMS